MNNSLVGYIREGNPHDLVHSLFPGVEWKTMQEEWDSVGYNGAPEMVRILYAHVSRLPVPKPGEVAVAPIFPADYAVQVATIVDKCVPHWNVIQKAACFMAILKELYSAGERAWSLRIQGKPMPPTPGQDIADNMLADVFGKQD